MKSKVILVTLLVLGTTAFAGGRGNEGGGGGKGSVCRNSNGSIQSVQLLDLWEAEFVWRRQVIRTDEPLEVQIDRAIENLAHAHDWKGSLISHIVDPKGIRYDGPEYFKYKMKDLTRNFLPINTEATPIGSLGVMNWMRKVRLELTADSFERVTPSECPVEQVIRYEDDLGSIRINLDLVEKMPVTDQAALIVHEAFYTYLRKEIKNYREENSLRVRRAVGLVFSGFQFATIESQLPKESLRCGDINGTRVYLVSSENGLDNSGRTCYSAAASSIQHQPILGFSQAWARSCPLKDRGENGQKDTFMTIEDIRSAGYYSKEEPAQQEPESMFGRFTSKFKSKPSPKAIEDVPIGYWSVRRGFSENITKPAVGNFDSDGLAVKPYNLELYSSKWGLRARILDEKRNVVVDDLNCN